MTSRRHRSTSAPPMDDDDLLREILLRLPPRPSSLSRASAVCKRWRLLVSDPRFLRRFRIHHRRNPPLLGYFFENSTGLSFVTTMEDPNRVPPGRLSLQFDHGRFRFLGCRSGLALISGQPRQQFLVWDPVTGNQHQLPIPPWFHPKTTLGLNGAVLRAAGDVLQVVFVAIDNEDTKQAFACVYSSETGLWGDLISTPIRLETKSRSHLFRILFPSATTVSPEHAVLVGDSLYWQLTCCSSSILEFDFEKQSLAVIQVPVKMFYGDRRFMVTRADGGGLGFLFLSKFTAQLWERKTDCDGVASWVLGRTIELDKLLSLNSGVRDNITILGLAEENNVVLLQALTDVYEVQLQSLQFKKLPEFYTALGYYPFESVYTAGIGSEHDGGQLLNNAEDDCLVRFASMMY